jgi:hypothetical protein
MMTDALIAAAAFAIGFDTALALTSLKLHREKRALKEAGQ